FFDAFLTIYEPEDKPFFGWVNSVLSSKYFWVNRDQFTSLDRHRQMNPKISVYPNPVNQDYIYIKTSTNIKGKATAQVFDTKGKLFLYQNLELLNNGLPTKLLMNDISNGIYILNIKGRGFNVNTKLVIN
ncbi:T9SS type A sorting domain-containing protein, partial [Saccharicrinis sp. 156]|uniref:T9SS type A sorting domain-containing protein n=1 Tax=Saccharicrinis sp. 156 TaxID=3417574 RepID=UPI003D34AB03